MDVPEVALSSMEGGTGKTTVEFNMAERAYATGVAAGAD